MDLPEFLGKALLFRVSLHLSARVQFTSLLGLQAQGSPGFSPRSLSCSSSGQLCAVLRAPSLLLSPLGFPQASTRACLQGGSISCFQARQSRHWFVSHTHCHLAREAEASRHAGGCYSRHAQGFLCGSSGLGRAPPSICGWTWPLFVLCPWRLVRLQIKCCPDLNISL